MTLSKLHLVDDDENGLFVDVGAAERNRLNIENMRRTEVEHHVEGGLRTEPLLPKIKPKENITQEVIKEMTAETKPEEKSKAQILYEQHAAEAHLILPWKALGTKVKEPWIKRADPNYVTPAKTHPKHKSATIPIASSKPSLPAFNESWSDPVKLAWFNAFTIANQIKKKLEVSSCKTKPAN